MPPTTTQVTADHAHWPKGLRAPEIRLIGIILILALIALTWLCIGGNHGPRKPKGPTLPVAVAPGWRGFEQLS